jgi:hypothetical protein
MFPIARSASGTTCSAPWRMLPCLAGWWMKPASGRRSKPFVLSLTIVEPASMFRRSKSVIVSCVKSGMTSMRTRPDAVPRRSTATITSAAFRPLSWRLPLSPLEPADPGLVHLDDAAELLAGRDDHRPPELVEQQPRRLV